MADLALNIRIRAINEAGSAVKGLAQDFRSLEQSSRKISGQARRGRGVAQIGRQAQCAGQSLQDAAQGLSDIGRGAQKLVGSPLDAVTRYETALPDIKTPSGAAAISPEQLADITSEAAAQFGGSAIDQAGSFYDIISAGATSAAEATATLEAANKFAIGCLTDVGNATAALSATTANFAQQGVEAAEAADLLFSIVDSGRTTADKVARSFPKVASAAGGVGIQAFEAAGAFAVLTRNAGSTAQASTQLANLIAATQKPTKQATTALEELNREREKLGQREIRIDTKFLREEGFAEFAKQFQGLDEGVLARLFGNQRARAAIVAFNQDIGALDKAIEDASNSAGKATAAFEKQDNTRAQSLKRLQAQQEQIKLAFGDAILPIVDELTPSFLGFAEEAAKFTRDSPVLAKSVGLFSIGAIGLGKVGEGIISITKATRALGAVVGPVGRGVRSLAASLGGPGKLAMVGAIGALSFAIGTFIDKQLGLSDKLAARFAGTEGEKRVDRTSAADLAKGLAEGGKRVVRDAAGNVITDPGQRAAAARAREREILREGTVKGDVRAQLFNEGFSAADIRGGASLALRESAASSRRTGRPTAVGGGQPEQLDVRIKVDQEGRVAGVTAGGSRAVRTDVGEGLATGL